MRGMGYLLLTGYKNALKNMVKNPAKLILFLFIIAMIILVIVSGKRDVGNARDIAELFAMVLALFTLMFFIAAKNGFMTGASFYSMADVNILFSAPISSKRILLYGLLKQVVSTLLVGIFLFFQYAWLHNAYGISFPFLMAIFFGYCGVIFCGQVTAMAIYAFTSGDEKRKRIVRGIFYGFYLVVLLSLPLSFLSKGMSLATVVAAVNAPMFSYLPVSGWFTALIRGCYAADWTIVLSGLGAVAVYILLFVILILRMRADYYEDVLLATEISFNAISGAKEGKMPEMGAANVKVKVGKTGLGKGWGASVFFFKHRLENRRVRVLLVDRTTWIWVAVTVGFSFFMRNYGILPVFAFAVYMQVFSVATGRWLRELLVHYVFLLPEKPFKKLCMICGDQIVKMFLEAVLIFIPAGLIVHATVGEVLGAIIGRFSFGVLFIAGNVLMERVFGHIQSKAVTILSILFYWLLYRRRGLPVDFC